MCDNHRQPNYFVTMPHSRLPCIDTTPNAGCCAPQSNSNSTTTTQTDICHHHHTQSREITRTNSAPALMCPDCNDDFCSMSTTRHHQVFRGTTRIGVLLRELLDRCIEDENTLCSEGCIGSRSTSGWQRSERCSICESDRQVVVSELMELLERFSNSGRTGCGKSGIVRWSERERNREWRGGCSGCSGGHEVRYEAQTLFEILLRITRRKSRSSHNARCGGTSHRRRCYSDDRQIFGERREDFDSSLRRLVGQLLDELEGNAGCECQSCCEYLETNFRRMRRELRRSVECSGKEYVCSGSLGACVDASGCSGCCGSIVSKMVVYGPSPRRSRTGNVHIGWSIR